MEVQVSATLLTITEAYLAIVDSGDCRSCPITGNSFDERRNCRQGACAHIFAKENNAILRGDSFAASFLLGFKATAEQSATNFNKACIYIKEFQCYQLYGSGREMGLALLLSSNLTTMLFLL